MNYSDLLAQRPFIQPGGGMGGGMAQNPYARLMRGIMDDIRTFRSAFPREGGDGMKPMSPPEGNMRRTGGGSQPTRYGELFHGERGYAQALQRRPTPQTVRSVFGG